MHLLQLGAQTLDRPNCSIDPRLSRPLDRSERRQVMQLRSRQALVACLEFSGMSERELARAAQLGHATVNHLFTGRRRACSLGTARAIERVFGCPPGALFAPDSDADRLELERLLGRTSDSGR